jgi:ABC-type lipoprotein export system ATPase subunit
MIEVDLLQDFGPSGSGKSNVIASSEGNQPIGKDDVKIGLNVYKPNK